MPNLRHKSGVFMTKDRMREVMLPLTEIMNKEVLVGVPRQTADRHDAEGKPVEINNAALAYIHNYGAPEANIPARPFMEPGIRKAKDKIAGYLKQAGDYATKQNGAGVQRAMMAAGDVAVASIKGIIVAGGFVPLKPATIAARRRRGNRSRKPLLDTRQMFGALTYVLADKAKKASPFARAVGQERSAANVRKPMGRIPNKEVVLAKGKLWLKAKR
ncbi:MAG: hypothetical protein ACREP9_09840 [Candidatus Dormibacteraceae bacterium]